MVGVTLRPVPSGATFKFGLTARRKMSAFLLALFMGLQLVAAAPAIHALIHPDCDSPQHECAVTLFTHGQVDAAVVAVPVIRPTSFVLIAETLPDLSYVSRQMPLPPSRGPPVVS
jgi:hypothetical protein